MRFIKVAGSSVIIAIIFSVLAAAVFASDKTKVNLAGTNIGKTVNFGAIDPGRTLLLKGQVKNDNMDAISNQLVQIAQMNKKPAYLIIDSPGGSIEAGLEFIDVMKAVKSTLHVETICIIIGNAFSMAGVIAAYCSETYIVDHGAMMFHGASYGIEGQADQLARFVDFNNKWLDGFEGRLAQQLGLTKDMYQSLKKDSFWLTASEAVSKGFADGIAENVLVTVKPVAENPFSIIFGRLFRLVKINE